jgi:hypothetical protein
MDPEQRINQSAERRKQHDEELRQRRQAWEREQEVHRETERV